MHKLNISFKDSIKTTILKNKHIQKFYLRKFPNSKYSLDLIIDDILYVLKTGIAWRDLRSNVNWQSVYFHFQRFVVRS